MGLVLFLLVAGGVLAAIVHANTRRDVSRSGAARETGSDGGYAGDGGASLWSSGSDAGSDSGSCDAGGSDSGGSDGGGSNCGGD